MSQTLILNSSNVVANSNNTRFRYNFARDTVLKDMQIAVKSIDMYNSIFNINATLYNNNVFQYYWYNGSGGVNILNTITIPDGYYDTQSINEYLQSQFILRGHCLTDGVSNYLFFIKITDNISRYAVQIDVIKGFMHSQMTEGIKVGGITYNYPAGATWQFHATNTSVPRIKFLTTNNFHKILGYDQLEYPAANSMTSQSYLSTRTPVMNPCSSIVVRCNLVKNNICVPNDVLHSFILKSDFGLINSEVPNESTWIDIQEGQYNGIELSLFDQNLNSIKINDAQVLFQILIKPKELKNENKNKI